MDNAERMKVAAAYRQSGKIHRDPVMRQLANLKEKCEEKGIPGFVIEGLDKTMELFMARERYCDEISTPPSEALSKLAADTMSYPWEEVHAQGKTKWCLRPGMVSGALEVVNTGDYANDYLRSDPIRGTYSTTAPPITTIKGSNSLKSLILAKRVLEIGMFTGYGALACAEVLPEDGEVVTCEFDPYLEGVARSFFDRSPHGKKIHIKIGPAQDTIVKLAKEGQSFDIVFIDANKDGYLGYFKTIMDSGLLNKNGTLIFDNALFRGQPYLEETTEESQPMGWGIKKCNEFVSADPRVRCVMVPIRDGILLVRRKEDFGDLENQTLAI